MFYNLTFMCLKKIWKSKEYVFSQMSGYKEDCVSPVQGYTCKPEGLRMTVMAQGYIQQLS